MAYPRVGSCAGARRGRIRPGGQPVKNLAGRLSVSILEAAELTGASYQGLLEMIHSGQLRAIRPGKRWLISVSSLKEAFDPNFSPGFSDPGPLGDAGPGDQTRPVKSLARTVFEEG
jgi:excisionase family DNA binding protein